MSSHKPDENSSYHEFYNYDKPVIVTSDIENIVLVPDIVCGREIFAYFRNIVPLGLLSDVIPSFQGNS